MHARNYESMSCTGSIYDPVLVGLPGGLGGKFTIDALRELGMGRDAVAWWSTASADVHGTWGLVPGPLPDKPAGNLLFVWFACVISSASCSSWTLRSHGEVINHGHHAIDAMLSPAFV